MAHSANAHPKYKHTIEHLVRALPSPEEDTLTCRKCQADLPDYVEAKIGGHAEGARWRPVARHLEVCPYCLAAGAVLTELLALAYGEKGMEPANYPEPDLSFLGQTETAPSRATKRPWRLNEWGHLLIEFSAELVRAWQAPAPGSIGLKSELSQRMLGQLDIKETRKDLEVTIMAEEKRGDPTRCTVIAEVNIPSRGGWPNLGGTEVIIKKNEVELARQLTDVFGRAIFEGITADDLAVLTFEIVPNKDRASGAHASGNESDP